MLTISVNNFGPIAEGSVDLKPLTIFVGPSNTGKSYMAAAVWVVAQAFEPGTLHFQYRIESLRRYSRAFLRARYERMGIQDKYEEAIKSLQDWIDLQGAPFGKPHEFMVADLPETVRLVIEQDARQSLDEICETVINRLRYAYGGDSEFARNGRTGEFSLSVRRDKPLLSLNVRLSGNGKTMPEFDISNAKGSLPAPRNWQRPLPSLAGYDDLAEDVFRASRLTAVETITARFPSGSYYMPAARSGIVQGHKVLSASLARQSRRIGLEPISIPSLPGMATEFLSNLLTLDRQLGRSQTDGDMVNAISFIETSVLRGKIDLDESDGLPYPEIVYLQESNGAPTGKFTLEHTSSMVSELAPLILFLKYLVNPGDLLILEEPESHLHPKAQLRMARGIARLVNAGVQVLITTHSSDFTGQINNLLSMSNVSQATAESLGLEPEECLQPEQVSAYGFRIDACAGGAVTYPLPVGSDVGIEDEEFLPVAEQLYHEALALQDARLT